MQNTAAIDCFSALAHESRLRVFKLLVRKEPEGLPVGEISRRLDIVPSTLSGHLSVLKRAGLLNARRQQREIIYTANLAVMNELICFMLADCCEGKAENCNEILSLLA